ncbi:thermonuclease family protein [Sphingobium sp. Z007]|uniref:thermonuclease family protein n=1 Tax=Sphingobium sp. Z007 TaxID=627495 RepID=UPI001594F483|nr:thermonuclease family protein [Sphingobium sp. Z007]
MANRWNGQQRPSQKGKVQQAWVAEARRAGAGRLRSAPARRRGLSGPALIYLLCLALLLGHYGPGWIDRFSLPTVAVQTPAAPTPVVATDRLSGNFGFCHSGGGTNCVVDGDTFWFRGDKYRIADIDTPETHGPRCAAEGQLGARATRRLQVLMNDGAFSLENADRDTDRYGRALRIVTREGQSIGDQLVAEGLARPWDGGRHPWC